MAQCSMCKNPESCKGGCMAMTSRKYSGTPHSSRAIPVRSNKRKTTISGQPNAALLRKVRV